MFLNRGLPRVLRRARSLPTFLLASLAAALLVLSPAESRAQQAVSGTVVDAQTGEPLRGAGVAAPAGTVQAVTDAAGSFTLTLPQGEDRIEVMLLGYRPETVRIVPGIASVRVRMEPSPLQLSEVVVEGYGANRRLLDTAGGVAIIPPEVLRRGNPVSMQQAFDAVPGVRMEMSNPNQIRLSVRGVGVRAHQSGGVRSFLNDIPITDAEGGTNFAQVDVTTLGQIEVVRGPSSSLYGAGLGGVVHLRTARPRPMERTVEGSVLTGADGLRRVGTAFRAGTETGHVSLTYGRFEYDGFRDHDRHARHELNAFGEVATGARSTLSVLATRTESEAQLAGGVTEELLRDHPRTPNATSLAQGVEQDNTWTRLGVSHTAQLTDRIRNVTVAHNTFGAMDHPVSSAVLRNTTHTFGARTRFDFRSGDETPLAPRLSLGAEYIRGLTLRKRYENLGAGRAGALIGDTEQTTPHTNLFVQAEADLTPGTILTLGLSYNLASLRVLDLLVPERSGRREFDATLSPRVALNHRLNERVSVHASASHGYLPPPAMRVIMADGTVNTEVDPETAVNLEMGARGLVLEDRLSVDLSLFSLRMRGELIPRSIDQGVTVWTNAGRTRHDGVELALAWTAWESATAPLSALHLFGAWAYSDFTFVDFVDGDQDYGGNAITGTAPHQLQVGIDLEALGGLRGSVRYSYTDRMPLNDRNTDFAGAYGLVSARLGWEVTLEGRGSLEAFVGAENLTDTRYASRLNFNAGGGNYYQPSPGRTLYAGLAVRPSF